MKICMQCALFLLAAVPVIVGFAIPVNAQGFRERNVYLVSNCDYPLHIWLARYSAGEGGWVAQGPWRLGPWDGVPDRGEDSGFIDRNGRLVSRRAQAGEGLTHLDREQIYVHVVGGKRNPSAKWSDFADHEWQVRRFETRDFSGSVVNLQFIGISLDRQLYQLGQIKARLGGGLNNWGGIGLTFNCFGMFGRIP